MESVGVLQGLTEEHKKLLCSMINRYSEETMGSIDGYWQEYEHYEFSGIGQHPIADLDTLKWFDKLYVWDVCHMADNNYRGLLEDEGVKLLDDLVAYLDVLTSKYDMRHWNGEKWTKYEGLEGYEVIVGNADDEDFWGITHDLSGMKTNTFKRFGGGALEWIEFTLRG